MSTDEKRLQAWHNGYEVVAATSEEEAREVLRATGMYEDDNEVLDGDGWSTLDETKPMLDEDGKRIGEIVGDVVRESPEPRHLWSCEV